MKPTTKQAIGVHQTGYSPKEIEQIRLLSILMAESLQNESTSLVNEMFY